MRQKLCISEIMCCHTETEVVYLRDNVLSH